MLLQVERTDAPRGFRLVGELDISTVDTLTEVLQPEIERSGDITLDIAGLRFLDSSGIQLLIRTARALQGKGRLILRSPGKLVRSVLELVSLDKLGNLEIVEGHPA